MSIQMENADANKQAQEKKIFHVKLQKLII